MHCIIFIIMSPAEGLHFSALVCLFVTRGAWAATGIVVCWFVCYPRRVWAATGIVVCWSVCYPRRAWAATGIVVRWSVCLFVMCESTHLHAMALRLQHG